MFSLKKLAALCGLASSFIAVLGQGNSTDWPLHDDGLTDLVEWQVAILPSWSIF
jgi:hypothetical protein